MSAARAIVTLILGSLVVLLIAAFFLVGGASHLSRSTCDYVHWRGSECAALRHDGR